MINLTKKWLNKGIVGFDRAGNELAYPLEMHYEV